MIELHKDLEKDFLTFNEIVPYDHNSASVYSPRLYSIFQTSCVQVISMMEHIVNELKGLKTKTKQERFEEYYRFLNKNGMLVLQIVSPKMKFNKIINPFQLKNRPVPDWWHDYNASKHKLPSGALVRMGNVLNALGGLAILHDIAELTWKSNNPNLLLEGKKWRNYSDEFINDYKRVKNSKNMTGTINTAERYFSLYKSQLFFYLCEFHL